MDSHLNQLIDLVQNAIGEAQKELKELDKNHKKLSDDLKLIAKLKNEIASENQALVVERKKEKTLTNRNVKLDKDLQTWREKVLQLKTQSVYLRSRYVKTIGADVEDINLEAACQTGDSDMRYPIDDPSALSPSLSHDPPELECQSWSIETADRDVRNPLSLPTIATRGTEVLNQSPKNGRSRKKANGGRKRRSSVISPDEEVTAKRIVKKRNLNRTDFKKKCLEHLAYIESVYNEQNTESITEKTNEQTNWAEKTEIAVIVAPTPGKDPDVRSISHKFKLQNMLVIPRRISKPDFQEKMEEILGCRYLKIFCMFGLGQVRNLEQLARSSLSERLAQSCPHIEHFILDDGLLDIAITYQQSIKNSIKVLELKNDQATEDDVIDLIMNSDKMQSVFLRHCSAQMIEKIVPRVTSVSLSWITEQEFQSLLHNAIGSNLTELRLETVDLDMDSERIRQLGIALPLLQVINLSAPLENIHCLRTFHKLKTVIFEAESLQKPELDPNFPIDMSGAIEMARQEDGPSEAVEIKKEEEDTSDGVRCQTSLEEFFLSCGSSLTSFSLTLRNKFKKDLFSHLKRNCPVLENLTIFSSVPQFFDLKTLTVPSLKSLSLHMVHLDDSKLIELLDSCINISFLSVEKPSSIDRRCRLTRTAFDILKFYGEQVFMKRESLEPGEKFDAIIMCEGKEELTLQHHTSGVDIIFKQKVVFEVSNRLRYQY